MTEEHGGFDAEFIDPVPDDLTCIVCHLALKDPIQIANCGHRFCNICFKSIESYSYQKNTELVCPLDRKKVDKNFVFSDQAASRAVLSLQVRCEQHAKGCTWIGDLRNLQEHNEKTCTKRESLSKGMTNEMESQLKDMMARMVECERCIHSQNQQIISLRENVQETDEKINLLEEDMERQLQKKNEEIEELTGRINILEESKSFHMNLQQTCENKIQTHEQKVSRTEARLINIEKLNPKMGAFDWVLVNYEHQSETSECVKSTLFHNYLNGHVCQLSVRWFNRRKSRLGVYFHVPKDDNKHINSPFHMKVVVYCIGGNNIQKSCVLTDWLRGEEGVSEEDNENDSTLFEVPESSGDEYFLMQPELNNFIVSDAMHFVCYLI